MSSNENKSADLFELNFERDMPLTEADIAALDRARELRPLAPQDYERWAALIEQHHPQPHRNNSPTDPPFELP